MLKLTESQLLKIVREATLSQDEWDQLQDELNREKTVITLNFKNENNLNKIGKFFDIGQKPLLIRNGKSCDHCHENIGIGFRLTNENEFTGQNSADICTHCFDALPIFSSYYSDDCIFCGQAHQLYMSTEKAWRKVMGEGFELGMVCMGCLDRKLKDIGENLAENLKYTEMRFGHHTHPDNFQLIYSKG